MLGSSRTVGPAGTDGPVPGTVPGTVGALGSPGSPLVDPSPGTTGPVLESTVLHSHSSTFPQLASIIPTHTAPAP